MRTRHFTLGIVLLLLTGTVGATETRTRQVHCKGGGTFVAGVETNLDTDGNGVSAETSQGAEVCNIGRFVFQEEVEWIRRPVTSACPAGTTDEFYIDATHGQQRAVATDQKTGDQLFGQITSGTFCLDFSSFPTPPFPFTVSGQNATTRGTGKYTGATGTGSFHTVGSYLAAGFKGGVFGGFGQFTFTADGTLTLPKGGKDTED